MSIFPDFLALRLACSSQQWIGFLPSLYCSRLHSARPAAYTLLGNEHQELMDAALSRDTETALTLLRNHIQDTLQRTIEAIERQQATLQ